MSDQIANRLGRLAGEILFSVLLGLCVIAIATLVYHGVASGMESDRNVIDIPVQNGTPYTIFISFSSLSGSNWPEQGYVWRLKSGETRRFSLQGSAGDALFYSAWAGENPSLQWDGNCHDINGRPMSIATFGQTEHCPSLNLIVYR
jgi:hypothetical protein